MRFDSLGDLDAALQRSGYVRIGLFGSHWPGRIVELADAADELHFTRADGTPHAYRKFDGYRLRLVRLLGGNDETLAIYRSQARGGRPGI